MTSTTSIRDSGLTETTHDAGNTVTDWAKDHTGYVVVGGFFGVAAVAEEINKRQKNKKV